jgi:hypothetical protein
MRGDFAGHRDWLRFVYAVVGVAVLMLPAPALAQKTDTVTVINGDRMVGEMKDLKRGQLQFKTDAMSTVYVRWPKVVTVATDKVFEIELVDGRVYFGSLAAGEQDSVVIKSDSVSVTVSTQSVVDMQRIKPGFWAALDGNVDLGINFTLQAKREVLKNFYVNLGVNDAFDSDPTAADANKNDFSFSTSFGWTF